MCKSLSLSQPLLLHTFLHLPTMNTFGPSLCSYPHQGGGAPQCSTLDPQGIPFTELVLKLSPEMGTGLWESNRRDPGQFLLLSEEITQLLPSPQFPATRGKSRDSSLGTGHSGWQRQVNSKGKFPPLVKREHCKASERRKQT